MSFQSRRRLIKNALGFTIGAGLTKITAGCASIDALILGENPKDPLPVAIIGGGLSGLVAAHSLKKNNIKAICFEAGPRFGGRVLSAQNMNSASQTGELGAEWISPSHQSILQLCRELRISVEERHYTLQDAEFLSESAQAQKALQRDLKNVLRLCQIKKSDLFPSAVSRLTVWNKDELKLAVQQDKISCEEFMQNNVVSKKIIDVLNKMILTKWGVDPQKLSSLQLIYLLSENKEHSLLYHGSQIKISGGTSILTDSLFHRVGGVIPSRFFRNHHKLIEIEFKDSNYNLTFSTPEGKKYVKARNVIVALPAHSLVGIKGFQDLELPQQVFNFKQAALAKAAICLTESIWKKKGKQRWSLNHLPAIGWEAEPKFQAMNLTNRSVVQIQWGGESAEAAGAHSISLLAKNFADSFENIFQVYNWFKNPWIQGGASYLLPGQNAELSGLFIEPFLNKSLYVVGEYTHGEYMGTMNAAVESAEAAVSKLVKYQKILN